MYISPNTMKEKGSVLLWWKDQELRFPTLAFLAKQIFGIPGSQIECERVFSIAGLLTGLRRCRLGSRNLEQLVLLVKNWPDDPRLGIEKLHASIEEFVDLEAELVAQLEDEFEDFPAMVEDAPDDELTCSAIDATEAEALEVEALEVPAV